MRTRRSSFEFLTIPSSCLLLPRPLSPGLYLRPVSLPVYTNTHNGGQVAQEGAKIVVQLMRTSLALAVTWLAYMQALLVAAAMHLRTGLF